MEHHSFLGVWLHRSQRYPKLQAWALKSFKSVKQPIEHSVGPQAVHVLAPLDTLGPWSRNDNDIADIAVYICLLYTSV